MIRKWMFGLADVYFTSYTPAGYDLHSSTEMRCESVYVCTHNVQLCIHAMYKCIYTQCLCVTRNVYNMCG